MAPRTWRSASYLLLGFPLGIAYFTFLVTGFSLGAGLIIIYAGTPVLAFTFMGAYFFCKLETLLANDLQGAGIIQPPAPWTGEGSVWTRVKRTLWGETTWKGVFFLFAMFPIGIATFTIVVTMVSAAFGGATVFIWGIWSDWYVDWEYQAIAEGFFFGLGVLMLFATPHLMNLMATGQSRFARWMLSDPKAVDGVPRHTYEIASTPEARRERAARFHPLAIKSFYIHASL
jgi:hypothetical protein